MFLRQFVYECRIPFAKPLISFLCGETEAVYDPLLIADQRFFSEDAEKSFKPGNLLKKVFLLFTAERLNDGVSGGFDEELSGLAGKERVEVSDPSSRRSKGDIVFNLLFVDRVTPQTPLFYKDAVALPTDFHVSNLLNFRRKNQ